MLDQIQETQETQDKTRNIRKLNPYPRQEQEINPKILGYPGNTQEISFLGKPRKTQEVNFLGISWVTQDLGLGWYFLSWVFPGFPRNPFPFLFLSCSWAQEI